MSVMPVLFLDWNKHIFLLVAPSNDITTTSHKQIVESEVKIRSHIGLICCIWVGVINSI